MYRPISDLYCCLRMWSFVGHFGVLVCLPVLLWLVFTRAGRQLEESVEDHLTHKLWFTTPVALTAIFLGLSYLLILCEVCISRTRPYIANLMHIDEARLYVHDMRKVSIVRFFTVGYGEAQAYTLEKSALDDSSAYISHTKCG